jgi:hypothetical protein
MPNLYATSLAVKLTNEILTAISENIPKEKEKNIKKVVSLLLEKEALIRYQKIPITPNADLLQLYSDIIKYAFSLEGLTLSDDKLILPEIVDLRCIKNCEDSYTSIICEEGKDIYNELLNDKAELLRVENKILRFKKRKPLLGNVMDTVSITKVIENKFSSLDRLLRISLFLKDIEQKFISSNKSREEFMIVIKLDFSYAMNRLHIGGYVDPSLVLYFVEVLFEKGFRNIWLLDTQSELSEVFSAREVVLTAGILGYLGDYKVIKFKPRYEYTARFKLGFKEFFYKLVDASQYDVSDEDGYKLSNLWKKADYRVVFSKLRTSWKYKYVGPLFNIFNLVADYRERNIESFISLLSMYPPDFSFVEAMSFSDGNFGFLGKENAKKSYMLFGAKNPILLDYLLGYMILGDPFRNLLLDEVIRRIGNFYSFNIASDFQVIPSFQVKMPSKFLSNLYDKVIKEERKLCSFYRNIYSTKDVEKFFLPFKCRMSFFSSFFFWYYRIMANRGFVIRNRKMKEIKKLIERYKNVIPLSYKKEKYAYNLIWLTREDIEKLFAFLEKNKKDIRKINSNIYWSGNKIYINNSFVEINSFSPLASFSAYSIIKGIKSVEWSLDNVLEDLEGWMYIHRVERVPEIL